MVAERPRVVFNSKWAWRVLGMVLVLLVFAVLPTEQVRLGESRLRGLVGSYLYLRLMPYTSPTNVRITRCYMPGVIRVEWDYPYNLPDDASFEIFNEYGPIGTTKDLYYDYAFGSPDGQAHLIRVRLAPDADPREENPELWGMPDDVGAHEYTLTVPGPSDFVDAEYLPLRVDAVENQTVDSRYDLRYGNPTFLDFNFGSRTYRGGLFVGYAGDPSRVGRSFARFELPELPLNAHYWAGSVNAYSTRAAASGSTEVGCHVIQTPWTAATLRWSNSPALTPGSPADARTLSWDAGSPESQWVSWHLAGSIEYALNSTGQLNVGLASTNENAGGWVYFAKKEWELDKAPCVVYCYEPGTAPNAPSNVHLVGDDVKWTDNSSDEDGFYIDYLDRYGAWERLAQVPANTTSFRHVYQHGIHGTTWTAAYRVRAFKHTGRCSAGGFALTARSIQATVIWYRTAISATNRAILGLSAVTAFGSTTKVIQFQIG